MNTELTREPGFEIIKFLYQFKDDNKFYKLDEKLLNIPSKKQKYISVYDLRDNALIATDSEVYYDHTENSIIDHLTNTDDIRAKILPKGVVAVEALLQKVH
jgi:hypothetical protein